MSVDIPRCQPLPHEIPVWTGEIDAYAYMRLAADAIDGKGNIVRLLHQGDEGIRSYKQTIASLCETPLKIRSLGKNSTERMVLLIVGITRVCTGKLLPFVTNSEEYDPILLGVSGAQHGIDSGFLSNMKDPCEEIGKALMNGRKIDDVPSFASVLLTYAVARALESCKPLPWILEYLQRAVGLVSHYDQATAPLLACEIDAALTSFVGGEKIPSLNGVVVPKQVQLPSFRLPEGNP
jgi:hypothetical protein